jgi:hypothetical protein
MDLGDGDRDPVTLPGLAQPAGDTGLRFHLPDPNRLDVDIDVALVTAWRQSRIMIESVIQKSFAGQIMVDAEQVRLRLAACETGELAGARAGIEQGCMPGMGGVDPAAKQVEAEPAPLILMLGLIAKRRR